LYEAGSLVAKWFPRNLYDSSLLLPFPTASYSPVSTRWCLWWRTPGCALPCGTKPEFWSAISSDLCCKDACVQTSVTSSILNEEFRDFLQFSRHIWG
jgi:hypothetical protein